MTPSAHATRLPRSAPARVLALGAFLKNRACLVDGDRVLWSALHGDLGAPRPCDALVRSVDALLALAGGPVHAIAHDWHPDFQSTRLATALAQRLGVPALGVQHHHAHAGVVLAEQGVDADVIAITLDGFGLGSDGQAWGGEVLAVGGSAHEWRRVDHLPLLALPGGDAAAREPWRLAAAVLFALGRGDEIEARFGPVVGAGVARLLHRMLEGDLNCPRSSSAGRWFDAAAGALGLSVRQAHEAEAATALERAAAGWLHEHPDDDDAGISLQLHEVVASLFDLPPEEHGGGALRFHLALAQGLARRAIEAAAAEGVRQVVLAGGCFANRVLTLRLRADLQRAGLTVLAPQAAGCGDEGLALGQAWIASHSVAAGADLCRSLLEA
jgi:hydrogenase maturation protein HypF